MLGFKSTEPAKRYCQCHGELKIFFAADLECATTFPRLHDVYHNMRRTATALGILEAV